MKQQWLMGLDLGGGGARCLLVDPGRGAVFTARLPGSASRVAGAANDLDISHALEDLAACAREAMQRAGATPESVIGVAATGMRCGGVVLDREGDEILAVTNKDARAVAEGMDLAAREGARFHQRTGRWPSPLCTAARLRWMARNAPEQWARAACALSISDWLGFRLTGERAADPTQAGETLLFDLEARDWAWDLIDELELPRPLFPAVREPGKPLGALHVTAAEWLGLAPGTPVAVAGGDSQCGLLGMGVVDPDAVGVVAGTSVPIQLVCDRALRDPEGRLWAGHHVNPGRWVLESNAGVMGDALEWMAQLLYPDAAHPVVTLLAEAAQSEAGAAGMHSTLGAQVMDAHRLELPIGNLTLTHVAHAADPRRRRHLARAVVEGLAYALRANLEQLRKASGSDPGTLRLSGGLSRSPIFTELVCEVFGVPVEVSATPEASALGAAICAGVGAGVLPDLAAGARELVGVARRHEPRAAQSECYAERYGEWTRLREARRESDALAGGFAVRGLFGSAGASDSEATRFRPRILVTADMDDEALAALRDLGEVEYASFRRVMRLLTGPSLVEALKGFHVLISEVDVIDGESLAALPELRALAACRGDAVNVDLAACSAHGIPVLNTPGRNADAVADLTLAFLLMLSRKLPEAAAFLRTPGGEAGDMGRMGQAFQQLQGGELWRKTVGLVGLGAVGRKVAERLRPFGARVLVSDPFLSEADIQLAGGEPAGLDELLERSDFVSLHAAVSNSSRGLLGAKELARMKPSAFLINTARAVLIDEEALIEALRANRIAGAALDAFAVEPPASDHPLLALPNVIATPHVGGNTREVAAHQGRIVAEDLARMLRGERPRNCLNPETLDDFRWHGPRPQPSAESLARLAERPGPAVSDLQRDAGPEPNAAAREPALEPAAGALSPAAGKVRDRMEQILGAFVEHAQSDPDLNRFAAGRSVILHFRLSDLDLDCHLGFAGDRVVGGTGAPPETAEVLLRMSADVFDGMFTRRVNAMHCAMDGRLSFTGDAGKAMTLQHIQKDLERLYRRARDEVGDPGDLAALAAEAPAGAPPKTATDDDARVELVRVVNELFAQRLITATGGNLSVRIRGSDELWITPSQLFKGDLSPEILVRIDLYGRPLDEGARSPSSERMMHCEVLRAKPAAQAVIHAHAPHATILANTGLPFLPISTEAAFFADLPRVPFIMPGTDELARACAEAMGTGWAVLMQNHGLLVAGRSLRRAADMVEIIDRSAEVLLGCYAVGKEPPTLPEDVVETLRKMGDLVA